MLDALREERKDTVWAWLFPVTYLIHIAEEYVAGVALAPSPYKIRGANMTPTQFLILNAFACVLLLVGILLSRRFGFRQWLLVCLATVVMVNGLFHVAGTIRIAGYNPGLASGVLIWIPLGVATLMRMKLRMRPNKYRVAVAVGIGINVVVLIIARGGRRLFEG
ncbi:MAG: HXXEE domain-containing protein [Pyrinomonadaceae bacterium]